MKSILDMMSAYNLIDFKPNPYVCGERQERERALIRCLKGAGQIPVQDKRVLEVGCGGGMNLVDLSSFRSRLTEDTPN